MLRNLLLDCVLSMPPSSGKDLPLRLLLRIWLALLPAVDARSIIRITPPLSAFLLTTTWTTNGKRFGPETLILSAPGSTIFGELVEVYHTYSSFMIFSLCAVRPGRRLPPTLYSLCREMY